MLSSLLRLKVKLFDCFTAVFVAKKDQIVINDLINCIISVDHSDKTMIQLHIFVLQQMNQKKKNITTLTHEKLKRICLLNVIR